MAVCPKAVDDAEPAVDAPMRMAAERTGQVLADTYRLTRLLGEGGMATVYEAVHIELPKRFAVKFLHLHALQIDEVASRFRREAFATCAIGHPNIVDVIDFRRDEHGQPYMVMEYLEGEDLSTRIKARGRLGIDETVRIADEIADALHAAHEKDIVHRDLKPQNVMLVRFKGRDDFVKVVDFGISKILDSTSLMTKTGAVFGTLSYMSPEQIDGHVDLIDRRTDVFALGATIYEMLTGRVAFDGPSHAAILRQVCDREPRPIPELRPDVPPALVRVVARAIAKKREDRFDSMAALREALAAVGPGAGAVRATVMASPPPPAPLRAAPVESAAPEPPAQEVAAATTFTRAAGESTLGEPARTRWPRWSGIGAAAAALAIVAAVGWRTVRPADGTGNGASVSVTPPSPVPLAVATPHPAPAPPVPVVAPVPARTPALAPPRERTARRKPAPAPAAPTTVGIRFTSDPLGARIVRLPDGASLCTTPCAIEVERDTVLRVRADKEARQSQQQTVSADRDRTVSFDLRPAMLDD